MAFCLKFSNWSGRTATHPAADCRGRLSNVSSNQAATLFQNHKYQAQSQYIRRKKKEI